MVFFWVMLAVPGTVDEGYSMRDDGLGIHRECRRLFFYDCLRTGVAEWRSFDPWKVVQSAEPILVGAGFKFVLGSGLWGREKHGLREDV